MEVADVAADADVTSREDDEASPDVPAEVIVVRLKQARGRELDVRLDESEPDEPVRLRDPESGGEHHVAHQGEHARVDARNIAEKVLRVRELELRAEHAPQRAERHAGIELLVFAAGDLPTSRIAAEIVPDERAHVRL